MTPSPSTVTAGIAANGSPQPRRADTIDAPPAGQWHQRVSSLHGPTVLPMRPLIVLSLTLLAALGAVLPAGPAWSQVVNASASDAAARNAALIARVPEAAGRWSRLSVGGARPGPDGMVQPAAEAEFQSDTWRAVVTVSGPIAVRAQPPAAPIESTTADGTERVYGDGGAVYREFVRRIDQHAELTLSRADGIVVVVKAYNVPMGELREIARAIR